jgi:hypothetical protein
MQIKQQANSLLAHTKYEYLVEFINRIKAILFARNSTNQAVHGCAFAACSPRLHARFKELKERKA